MPEDFSRGSRKVPFTKVLYVEQDDFREDAPKKWYRLAPGKEVRLRYACLVTCTKVIKDDSGRVVEIHCTWDPDSRGGVATDGRKVKGTIHWVSAEHAVNAEIRLYDRLFTKPNPMDNKDGSDFKDHINPDSLEVLTGCRLEPSLLKATVGEGFQFERLGYFCVDPDSKDNAPVFNRTVTLRDTWAKIEKHQKQNAPKKKKEGKKKEKKEDLIKIDDFARLDLRVGTVKEASLVEGADKLLRLMVDIGEEKPRQIFSGIRSSYPDPAALVGKQVMVLANLKPRKMKFGLSEGMVLAGRKGENWFVVTFDGELNPGDKVS
jgi:methionine--tRNA ligase beta chain